MKGFRVTSREGGWDFGDKVVQFEFTTIGYLGVPGFTLSLSWFPLKFVVTYCSQTVMLFEFLYFFVHRTLLPGSMGLKKDEGWRRTMKFMILYFPINISIIFFFLFI